MGKCQAECSGEPVGVWGVYAAKFNPDAEQN